MRDGRWIRIGGVAGIGFVLIALVAAALPGAPPRWTAYFAILAVAVSVIASTGVFFRTGPMCLEGGFFAWAPALTTVLWYLGTSIAMLRTSTTDTCKSPRRS